MNWLPVTTALIVALWCVFAPAWAYKRGMNLGARMKAAELLPLLRKSSELMQEHQRLMAKLLGKPGTPSQEVEQLLSRHRSRHD